LIDRIRQQIEDRLDQLLGEAEKLRKALAARDPCGAPASTKPATRSVRPRPTASAPRRRTPTRTRQPTTRGATKASVLAVLSERDAMTAGEVAAATGLGRGTVSTTLSKLAKAGEVQKAERGYQLPAASATARSDASASASESADL
jgi:DNA-binding transcriptional ArsR family regulator